MRTLFWCVVTATCTLVTCAADAQLAKPKSPADITASSNRIAQRNEDCRRQARKQHLHLLKRYRFMRDCKRQ